MAADEIPLPPTIPEPVPTQEGLEESLGYVFQDRDLLNTALTHRSYSNEMGGGPNYERLEFLGDSVVGLVAARWLYDRHPEKTEGELAKLKSFLVSTPSLSRRAKDLGAGELLVLGVGEKRSGGGQKSSILADVLESLIGAIFLDSGLDAAHRVMIPLFEKSLTERESAIPADAKTRLQEVVQGKGWERPEYHIIDQQGPAHQKHFQVECRLRGSVVGTGEGRSKKIAQQAAAAQALKNLVLTDET